MQNKAQAVVISGGIVGCAILYHLVKGGWKDVVLLERKQLAAGSTWRAAAGFHALNGDPNIAKLKAYAVKMYDRAEHLTDRHIGLQRAGGPRKAQDPVVARPFAEPWWGRRRRGRKIGERTLRLSGPPAWSQPVCSPPGSPCSTATPRVCLRPMPGPSPRQGRCRARERNETSDIRIRSRFPVQFCGAETRLTKLSSYFDEADKD
ncbi:MAG: FAD-binding oxidoreductase [Pseudomonadota bacterium]